MELLEVDNNAEDYPLLTDAGAWDERNNIKREETEKAIKALRNGEEGISVLHCTISSAWKKKELPGDWSTSVIVRQQSLWKL